MTEKMRTYEELWEEFQQKVKELQEKCNHPKTNWMREVWAIGHSTGFAVKVCEICHKVLERIPLKEAYGKGYLKK